MPTKVGLLNVGKESYPFEVAVDPTAKRLYVSNSHHGTVAVVDTESATRIKVIPVGTGRPKPRGCTIFVDCEQEGSLPFGVDLNTKTKRLYVANYYDSTVSVIDTTTDKEIAVIPVGAGPAGPEGCRQFVDCNPSGSFPTNLAVNSKTNRIFVGDLLNGTVSVINGRTNKVIKVIKIGSQPKPAGCEKGAYGECEDYGSIPEDLAVSEKTNRVYVTLDGGDSAVAVLDGDTYQVLTTIPVANGASAIALNEKTDKAYIAQWGASAVVVLDLKTNAVVGDPIPAGPGAHVAKVDEQNNMVYTGNYLDGTISIIDGATNQRLKNMAIGSGRAFPPGCYVGDTCERPGSKPSGFAIDPLTRLMYVTAYEDGTLQVLKLDPDTNP